MQDLFIYSVLIAVIAVIYKKFLSQEPILNWWFKIGDRFYKRWFYAPIWGCEFCFAGQLALWTFSLNWLGSNFNENAPFWQLIFFVMPKYHFSDWSVFSLVNFICLTIFNVFLISKLYKYLNNEN